MTLEKLHRDWQNYVWDWKIGGKVNRLVLKKHYNRCEIKEMKNGTKCLLFHLRYDDGSWSHEFDVLRCDTQGNCYMYTFYTNNITKYYWKKTGRFVKLPKR